MPPEPLSPLELGNGIVGEFVYEPNAPIPRGLIVHHPGCEMRSYVGWCIAATEEERDLATLESLVPLTLTNKVICPACGLEGFVIDGAWWAKKDANGGDRTDA